MTDLSTEENYRWLLSVSFSFSSSLDLERFTKRFFSFVSNRIGIFWSVFFVLSFDRIEHCCFLFFVFLFFFFPPIWIVYFEGLFKDCREYFVIRLGTFLFSYVFHTPMLFPSALSVSRDDGCLFFSFFSFRVIVTISAFIRVF